MTFPDSALDSALENLIALDDKSFERLVSSNLRPAMRNATIWNLMLSPHLIQRTRKTLIAVQAQATGALRLKDASIREAGLAPSDDIAAAVRLSTIKESRKASVRFLRWADESLAEVTAVMQERGVETSLAHSKTFRRLVEGVIAHEEEMKDDGSEVDNDLWTLLDELTLIIDGRSLTLREAHDCTWGAGDAL